MNIIRICFIALVFIGFQSCKNENSANNASEQTLSNIDVVEENVEINGVNHYIKKIGKGSMFVQTKMFWKRLDKIYFFFFLRMY